MEARMTADRISELVAACESETLEFKRTTGQRSDAAKTLCAMLNHRGGHVLFGVTPPTNGLPTDEWATPHWRCRPKSTPGLFMNLRVKGKVGG